MYSFPIIYVCQYCIRPVFFFSFFFSIFYFPFPVALSRRSLKMAPEERNNRILRFYQSMITHDDNMSFRLYANSLSDINITNKIDRERE